MTETPKPTVAQTLTLLFENDPTWGDLIWFVEQAKSAGVGNAEPIVFEYDEVNPQEGPYGISLITHPDPAKLLGE